MFRWLRPPQIDDELKRVAYHSLHYTLQLVFVLGVLDTLPPDTVSQMIIHIIGLSMVIFCYVLLQRRQLELASTIFLGGAWLLITTSMIALNGINNEAVFGYVIIIVFVNIIFVRRQVVYIFTVLSILSCLVLTIGEVYGVLPLESSPRSSIFVGRLLVSTMVFSAVAILSSYSSTTLRRNLAHMREHEEDLQARNRELEDLTRSLAASEERYRLLFDNAITMAAVYDADGQIILINDAAVRASGKSRSDLVGRNMREVYWPDQAEVYAQMHREAITSGKVVTYEGSNLLPNGQSIYYLRHAIPLPSSGSASSDKPQVLALANDLTEHQRSLERQQELKAAQEKIAFFTDFFGTISHDIKTPLAVMETSLYLLERADDAGYRQQKIFQLRQQVGLLTKYIQDMLMVSRLEQVPTLDKAPVDVKSLTSAIVTSLTPNLEAKNIQFDFQCQADDIVIEADQNQMHRALINLIENAINYTPKGGQVSVIVSRQNGAVYIEVRDTGIGIQAKDIPLIFEKFFRSSDAKSMLFGGTGLGLAIVKKIIDLHGGTISVTSQPQQGSSFLLTLPASKQSLANG